MCILLSSKMYVVFCISITFQCNLCLKYNLVWTGFYTRPLFRFRKPMHILRQSETISAQSKCITRTLDILPSCFIGVFEYYFCQINAKGLSKIIHLSWLGHRTSRYVTAKIICILFTFHQRILYFLFRPSQAKQLKVFEIVAWKVICIL